MLPFDTRIPLLNPAREQGGEARFPPAVPHVPLAAKLPVWGDVPRADVDLFLPCAIQYPADRRKHVPVISLERVARELGR
jgi:hypothetical protein